MIEEIDAEVVDSTMADPSIDPDATFKELFHLASARQKKCMNEFAEKLQSMISDSIVDDAQETSDASEKEKDKAVASFARNVPVYGLAQRHAHYVAKLQRRLDQQVRLAAIEGRDPDVDPQVTEKRQALAKAVDKAKALEQLRQIEKQLQEIPPKPSGDSSAFDEYARMREQAKSLRTEMADAVGEALTALAPPTLEHFPIA